MKILIALTAIAALFTVSAFGQQQSEAVVNGTIKTVTRLVSITPTYSNDSAVKLLSLTENFKTFSVLPDNSIVAVSTFNRQWTWESITNLSLTWTNKANVVINNNAYRAQLESVWTRLDLQPERSTLTFTQPNILTPIQ